MRLGCLDTGTNSERVAKTVVSQTDTIVTFRSMQEIFSSLTSKQIDYAVIPVKNSITGEIRYKAEIHKLNLVKIGEQLIDIRHCLAVKDRPRDIGFVLSHPEALKQCKTYLERFPQLYIGETGNTAEAARIIANVTSTNGAAIADYEICLAYDLNIIEQDIVKNNRSLFWVVKNG